MRAPIGLLIISVLVPPLCPAVLDHLRIHRIGLNFPPVVVGPAMPLALGLAANALLKSIRGWMKTSPAVRTAADLSQCVSSEIESFQLLSKPDKRKDVETNVEYLPRPRPG